MADLLLAIGRRRKPSRSCATTSGGGIYRNHCEYLENEYLPMRGLQHLARHIVAL
jgi:hypothetical protein